MKYLALISVLFCSSPLYADSNDPITGGCIAKNADQTCRLSAQMSMLAPVTAINFKTGDIAAGGNAIALGPCYGVTYQPGRWYASGADLCLTLRAATGVPNQYTAAFMLHTVRVGAIGIGAQGTQNADRSGIFWQAVGFIALHVPVL
jgi:hypothetical protein